MPICSVITPCYNSEQFIARTIASVLNQTLTDWEYIVVDDGSSDNSIAVVEEIVATEPRMKLIRQANAGVAAARNAGYRAVSPESRALLFLDADDCLEPQALATMVRYLDQRPRVGAVYGAWRCIDADDRPIAFNPFELQRRTPAWLGLRVLPDSEPETPFSTLLSCFMAFPSVTMLRRSVFEQTPGFDNRYRINSDKDIVLQVAIRAPVHYIPVQLMRYRRHGNNMSSNPRMFQELRGLIADWWNDTRLTPAQRRRVRNAILFDRWLSVVRDADAAFRLLMRQDFRAARRSSWHAARKSARLVSTAGAWLLAEYRAAPAMPSPPTRS